MPHITGMLLFIFTLLRPHTRLVTVSCHQSQRHSQCHNISVGVTKGTKVRTSTRQRVQHFCFKVINFFYGAYYPKVTSGMDAIVEGFGIILITRSSSNMHHRIQAFLVLCLN